MDDLISRQKVIKHLRKRLIETANNNVGFQCDAGETFQDAFERVSPWVNELPSVDAVEVVRCKDCIHSTEWYRDKRRCFLWNENGISVFEDGFCNYGERKDD